MLMPFMVATTVLFSSLLAYGTAMHLETAGNRARLPAAGNGSSK